MYSKLFIREAVEKVLLLCKRVFVRFPRRGGRGESVRERVARKCYGAVI